MFCPVCKAEYRDGFTRCADCDAELVHDLPSRALVASEPAAPGDPDEDPFCAFWSGDDSRLHAELSELLDRERIPHKTVRREDHLFHFSRYPAFQIGIPFSLFEKAETAVKEAYGSDSEPQEAPLLLPYEKQRFTTSRTISPWLPAAHGFAWSSNRGAAEPALPAPPDSEDPSVEADAEESGADWDPQNWHAQDASAEVWSGESAELAEMLVSSLGENHIHCRRSTVSGEHQINVLPEDETRAREIAREVVEGVPPE